MKPTDFLDTAEDLLKASVTKPRQANLRRACSTMYYAMFHTLCECCATTLVGMTTKRAWQQAYRFINHSPAKVSCMEVNTTSGYPQAVVDFANLFARLQGERHLADYSPVAVFYKSTVESDLEAARDAIKAFKETKLKDRRAFAAHIALNRAR